MVVNFLAMDLAYELSFHPTYIELPERGSALLKAIHRNLSSHGYIASADMQVFGGAALSDVGVRVLMFNQHARIEISATNCVVRFNQMYNSSHLELCKACVSSVERVLKEEPTKPQFGFCRVEPMVWFDLGAGSATDFLAGLMATKVRWQLTDLEGVCVHPGLSVEFENQVGQWSVAMNLFRGRDKPSQLMFSCHAVYGEKGVICGARTQVEHTEQLINRFLNDVGLEVSGFYPES